MMDFTLSIVLISEINIILNFNVLAQRKNLSLCFYFNMAILDYLYRI